MKAFLGLLFVVAALLAVSNAATYTSSFGFFDGRSIRFWNFGESTNGNSVIAQSYLVTITVPNTAVPSSVDGSTGEHQNLRCGNETCPLVFSSRAASLFFSGKADLEYPLPGSLTNTSVDSVGVLTSNDAVFTNGTVVYRRIVAETDTLDVGGSPSQAWVDGDAVFYLDFGVDSAQAVSTITVYNVTNATDSVLIFGSQSTHFAKFSKIVIPADSKLFPSDIDRFSDIPKDWLTNSTIITNDPKTYELGFTRVSGTPPPVAAAAAIVPSVAALLFAALLALLL